MIRTTAALVLAAGLAFTAASPAQAFDVTQMSEAERAAFQAEIRSYLLENPQVVMEAAAAFEQQQVAAQAANDVDLVKANAADLFEDASSWVGGNPEGDITIVEFIDYRCGYCRKAHDEVAQLLKSDGDIKLIMKEFPILGEASTLSSRFAIATRLTAGDEAYKAVGDTLIKLKSDVNETVLRAVAESLQLDADAILLAMNSAEVNTIIAANHQLGQRLSISGTPTFIMQDQVMRGYMPLDAMQGIVAALRDERG
ncbi:DsbA family protein [Lentibacter algarum]|uniref:DsbA family protein n=1 Tax=Lentibacter algarum TaxID=576131 RepID=UPI001C090974|nr:DsbA family protein [Lentibacter algarum]MBU2982721.1 DsbA family protein [Lentibacter algarum]